MVEVLDVSSHELVPWVKLKQWRLRQHWVVDLKLLWLLQVVRLCPHRLAVELFVPFSWQLPFF